MSAEKLGRDEARRLRLLATCKNEWQAEEDRLRRGLRSDKAKLFASLVSLGWWEAIQLAAERLRERRPPGLRPPTSDYDEGLAAGYDRAISDLIGPEAPQADKTFLVRELADWFLAAELGESPRAWCGECGAMVKTLRRSVGIGMNDLICYEGHVIEAWKF